MEVSAVGSTTAPQTAGGLASMDTEDFFKILVTEMQNQDPFEPSDTSDLISQVSQIRTIEQADALTSTLDLLTQQQRMGGVTGLIGKYVQAIAKDDEGNDALYEGVVTSVYFNSDGSAVLELDTGQAIPADSVVRVTTLEELALALAESEATSEQTDETDGEQSDDEADDA
jgi:flagellar basal-body rod modification protein FlgD